MVPLLQDVEVREFASRQESHQAEIGDLLALLAFASGAEKSKLYRKILAILQVMRQEAREWSNEFLSLDRAEFDFTTRAPDVSFLASMFVAINAIQAFAVRLMHGNADPSIGRIRATKGSYESRLKFVQKLRQGFLILLGADGISRTYALDYYSALTAFMARQTIISQQAIAVVTKNGGDLVQVSPQPSTIGDFCDLYRGKVFSVSGNDPFFHPLSVIPNGNCPMHPWCHHVLLPFDPRGVSEVQKAKLKEIPDAFLALGRAAAPANAFHKLWGR